MSETRNKFLEWLKQQSTWKAIAALLGVAGIAAAPDRVGEIAMAVGVIYAFVAGVVDTD